MRGFIHRVKALFFRGQWEREMREEIEFHLEMETKRFMAAGLSPEESRRRAQLKIGGEEIMRSRARDERGTLFWDRTLQDLSYGFRVFRQAPGFTLVAILTLALGIGGTVALSSAVYGVLLRPLPFEDEDRLVSLWFPYSWRGSEFDFARERVRSFESLAAYSNDGVTLQTDQEAILVSSTVASAELFHVLGARPLLGQTFRTGDDRPGAEPVLILSHRIWQQHYGSDPGIVGQRIDVNGKPTTVLGVMPRSFYFPTPDMEVWTPLDLDPANGIYGTNGWLVLTGRLKEGVTEAQLQDDLDALGLALGEERNYPEAFDKTRNPHAVPLRKYLVGDVRPVLLILLGAVALVLLMACVNVAALLLTRAMDRSGEMSVRAALGAGRGRLARQVLTESVLLGLVSGGLGVGLAVVLFDVLVASLPLSAGLGDTLTLDWTALLLGLFLAITVGSLIALAPIRNLLRGGHPGASLGRRTQAGGGGGSTRLHASLVVAEVLLSVVMATGAALLIRTVDQLRSIDIGMDPEGVAVVSVILPPESFAGEERAFYFETLVDRAHALPGVEAAGLINRLPVRDGGWQGPVQIEDRPDLDDERQPNSFWRTVTPATFRALGFELVEGRGIQATDRHDGLRVVVVNETFAQRMWPGESALGRRLNSSFSTGGEWTEVVGVVRNVAIHGMVGEVPMAMYLPWDQVMRTSEFAHLVLKTGGDAASLGPSIRQLVREVDRRATLGWIQTMDGALKQAMAEPLRLRFFLGIFSLLGITLGVVGVYGVVSYGIRRRRAEFGVRMALGARPGRVLMDEIRTGMVPVFLGVAGGLAVSVLASSLLSSFLFEVAPTDPLSLAASALTILLAGALAALIPSFEASRTQPATALRSD